MVWTLVAVVWAWPLAFMQGGDAVQLPPQDYVFVDAAAAADPARLLAIVRQSIETKIREAGLAEPGYPEACAITRTPIPDQPARYDVTCVPGRRGELEPDGLLLDNSGRFLELGIVDFPDSRLWVMKIYAVPYMPFADLETEAGWSIPRVVVRFPHVDPSWYPRIWPVLKDAITQAEAKELERR